MSIAASVARGRDARSRGLIWLSILTLVGSLLIVGATRPEPVLGAPGGNTVTFGVAISPASPTAGTAFTVTVTAKDSRGRTVNSFSGPASLSGLADAPYGQAPTYGQLLVWDGGVSTTTAVATKSQAGAKLTASAVIDGATVSGQSAAFTVLPGGATSIAFADAANAFDGQPVDTETGLPIKSSLTASDPVKVIALDQYGNRVSGVGVTVSSSPTGAGPTTVNTASGTPGQSPYGEASFSSLSITPYGRYVLSASAGALSATSVSFEVVADLANCSGQQCKSTGKSAGTNLQVTYSSLSGVTTFSNVTLTTSFIGDATDAGCTGAADAFGELSEVRVQGAGVTTVQPDFQLAMIIPKATLQSFALTSRAADSFNMCLGAVRLDGGTAGWHGRATIGGPIVELGADGNGIYWGWVADCGTAGVIDGEDPCVSLKTKNAGQLQAELGMTKNEFKALGFASSDLALVIEKPYPWDGKTIFK